MERFYTAPDDLGENEAVISGEEFKHLKHVLRMKAGDAVEVFDGEGRGFRGRLREVGQSAATVLREAWITRTRDSWLDTCLVQGIPKGEKMDWLVQKATELGVGAVLPLELSRCVTRFATDEKRREKQARWQKIAREAARQCGRLRVPELLFPLGPDAFFRQVHAGDLLLIPWEEGGQPLRGFFAGPEGAGKELRRGKGRIFMMIGPEGGMTAEETESGVRAGGRLLTLGPRLLRTETAGLMLLSVLQYLWGDMGGEFGENGENGERGNTGETGESRKP